MISIKDLIQRPEFYKKACQLKNVEVDIDRIVHLKLQANQLQQQLDQLTHQLKQKSHPELSEKERMELKQIKERTKELANQLKNLQKEIFDLIRFVPNPPLDFVPPGKDENDNKVIKQWGRRDRFNFQPQDYLTLAEKLDIIDVKRASKISGTRFGYLKKEAVWLEISLINFVFNELTNPRVIKKIIKKNNLKVKTTPFTPIIPPVMIKPEVMWAMGYLDRAPEEVYQLKDDPLVLVGTSEQSIGSLFKDEIILEEQTPIRFIGFSSCFRREAGSYGKDTKGIIRVHQFDKLEMISFTTPEDSDQEHKFLLAVEEYLMQKLDLPYRVLLICTGDLGDSAAAKYDIEVWLPGQKIYKETHSTSNTTDFQARRLNTRIRRKNNKLEFAHILNGTAFAIGRTLVGIIENYQTKEGWIKIPKVLKKYLPFSIIKREEV